MTFSAFLSSEILFNMPGDALISTVQGPGYSSCCAKRFKDVNPALGLFYPKGNSYCTVTVMPELVAVNEPLVPVIVTV